MANVSVGGLDWFGEEHVQANIPAPAPARTGRPMPWALGESTSRDIKLAIEAIYSSQPNHI
jgi:hypothetical protein